MSQNVEVTESTSDSESNAPTKEQIALSVLRGIRQVEEDIVIAVETALDKGKYDREGRNKLEASQFRNLVRVAEATESPAVVKNFLRYQVGRDRKWGRGKDSLAEHIINDIDGVLRRLAANIAKSAGSTDNRRIHINLIRRYLGYGSRRLRYLSDG
ncbi:MAG: hypothetical protein AAFP20_20555 [Cyanobacteria bacterium J06614_10]